MAFKDELDVLKWWMIVGIAAITFKAMAKVAGRLVHLPAPVQGIIES